MSRYSLSRPANGVAAMVTHQNKVLPGLRKRSEEISRQLPEGWLLPSELPPDANIREIDGELGVKITTPKFVAVRNNIISLKRHRVSQYFEVEFKNRPTLSRKNFYNCQFWQWFDWKKLPVNLFYPLELLSNTDYNPLNLNKAKPYVAF